MVSRCQRYADAIFARFQYFSTSVIFLHTHVLVLLLVVNWDVVQIYNQSECC